MIVVTAKLTTTIIQKENKMSTLHSTLAYVTKRGVAKIIYAHPAICEKGSRILNNPKVITQSTGSFVKISMKRMGSGKRMLISCAPMSIACVQDFIDQVTIITLKGQAERENKAGTTIWTIPENFDGTDDKDYFLDRTVISRFGKSGSKDQGSASFLTEDGDSIDGFQLYGKVYIPEATVRALKAAHDLSISDGATNILIIGPSGNGKTSLAQSFASEHSLNFVKVNCSTVRDPEEWFGYREAQDGTTVFVETEFTQAVNAGHSVILLDELNRLEPYLHNSLLPLLDETRRTQVHGHDIVVGPETIFISTVNLGAGFTGTFILDMALKNRMDMIIKMEKLSQRQESKLLEKRTGIDSHSAIQIIEKLEKLREAVETNEIEIDVSHRSALKVARIVKNGTLTLREALTIVIFNSADTPEQSKILVDALIGG